MKSPRILLEMILMMLVSTAGMLLMPPAKTLFALTPVVYLLIERQARHRSWAEIGLKFGSFWADLRANWIWFVLVGLVSQPLTLLAARTFLPDFTAHLRERLPMDPANLLLFMSVMIFSVLGEELAYRALLQGRLTPFTGIPVAVVLASALFAVAHYSAGSFAIVAFDLGTIFIDAVLFGIIYSRSQNATVTWAAHFLGNTMGLIALAVLR